MVGYLWRVVKRPNGWAEPVRLGPPVNSESFDSWPSLSRGETLYFFSTRDGGFGGLDLYRSALHDSEYSEVENPGNVINTEFNDHDPFIAHDESYLVSLVWCSDRPERGQRPRLVTSRRARGSPLSWMLRPSR